MDGKRTSCVSIGDAARRVGVAIYGEQWIGQITKREAWLIARYVKGLWDSGTSSIIRGQIGYIMGGRTMAEWPSDPELLREVERARDRDDWRREQWRQAFEWLKNHGFEAATTVNSDLLAREMATEFRSSAASSTPERKPGAKPLTRNRIIEMMKTDLNRGYDLAGAKEEELRNKYGASRDTCRKARQRVLSK